MKEYKDLQFKAAEDMVSKPQILPNLSQRVEIKSLVSLALNVGNGNGGSFYKHLELQTHKKILLFMGSHCFQLKLAECHV